MKYAIIGLLLLAAAFLLVYDLKFAEGRKHRLVIIVNSVLGVAAVGAVLYGVFANMSYKDDKDRFDVSGDDLIGAIRYVKTEDDYYIFTQSQVMSPASYIAVPKDQASLPSLTALYPYVMLYSQWGAEKYTADFSVGKCSVWSGVVKIVPEHVGFAILTVMFSLLVIFIYDLITFIRTFSERRKVGE